MVTLAINASVMRWNDDLSPVRPRHVVLLLLLMLMVSPAFSAQVSGLYGAEVPVEGQETGQRNKAIADAFRQVLVKVTGNRDVIKHPQLASEIRNAPRYVQQYRYHVLMVDVPAEHAVGLQPEPDVGGVVMPSLPMQKQLRILRVTFDEKAVNRMLRQHGIAVWGDRRPATLVWLAVEQNGRRNLVITDSDEQLYARILDVMDVRGVPILFPLMDLEDQTQLQVSDVWGGFADTIWQASARYSPDAVMTTRLVKFGSALWRAKWTLLLDKKEFLWDSEGESLAMAVEAGIHAGMDMLASHYAPSTAENSVDVIYLHVADVDDLYSFARLQRHLGGQDVVEQPSLAFVEPGAVTYVLRVRGGQRALEQNMALSRVLIPYRSESMGEASPAFASEAMADSGDTVLYYQLQP